MERAPQRRTGCGQSEQIEASQGRQIAVQAVPSVALSIYPVEGDVLQPSRLACHRTRLTGLGGAAGNPSGEPLVRAPYASEVR
jgi:hypothetical protein